MRNKYIRFFISSTFGDFEIERNILVDIFEEISKKYLFNGWQIEMVDLRWGISKESGIDNQTMRICKAELSRCQEMSPKPNFIILHGDRYGWIPLPEVVSMKQYKSLKMTFEEQKLFEDWYKLDTNVLPDGTYVLKSQISHGVYDFFIESDEIRQNTDATLQLYKDAEKSLSAIFERNNCRFYGSSATEQEIEMGALNVKDANKHVIAFLRHIDNIPDDKIKEFYDIDEETGCVNIKSGEKVKTLKTKILEKLSQQNIIQSNLDYKQYNTDKYRNSFKDKMKKHIEQVVDNIIDEVQDVFHERENQLHVDYALDEAKHFIGRESELKDVDIYLYSSEQNGRWYIAPSGTGKTALLAKIVDRYRDKFDVVCRFCGTTQSSINPYTLLDSIKSDISELNISKESKHLDKYTFNKPILLVIDSLDRVNSKDDRFDKLEWIKRFIHPDIKIIISTINTPKYSIEFPCLNKVVLSNMCVDSFLFVMKQINNASRTLSEDQKKQLEDLVEKSDKSALYLKLLGNILSQKASWENIAQLPSNISDLVADYIIYLISTVHHEWILVLHVLSWYSISFEGLTDCDILNMLNRDEEYLRVLKEKSYHKLNGKDGRVNIPSIIWIRLRHDLKVLLRNQYKEVGMITSYFHVGIKKAVVMVLDKYKQTEEYARQAFLLHEYFSEKIPEKHALMEVVPCLYEACKRQDGYIAYMMQYMSSNIDYILNKKLYDSASLMNDYDLAIRIASAAFKLRKIDWSFVGPSEKVVLMEIKSQLQHIPDTKNSLEIKLALRRLPASSPLRDAIEKYDKNEKYMSAGVVYSQNNIENTLVVTDIIGNSPCMSQDGTVIASLINNNCTIYVDYLYDKEYNFSIDLSSPAIEIKTDDNVNNIVIRFESSTILFDVIKRKTAGLPKLDWVDISADGCTLALGDSKGEGCVIDLSTDGKSKHKYSYKNVKHARLSPSGKYLWIIHKKNNMLYRHDILEDKYIHFESLYENDNVPYIERYSDEVKNLKENLKIVSCSDTSCILGDFYVCYNETEDGKFIKGKFEKFRDTDGNPHHPHQYIHRTKNIFIDPKGLVRNLDEQVCDGYVNVDDIVCLNGDFTIALSLKNKRVYKFMNELETYKKIPENFSSYNISSDYRGYHVLVSQYSGTGWVGGYGPNLLRIKNKGCYTWNLNKVLKTNNRTYPAHAISPDGKFLAVSTYGNVGGIYYMDLRTEQIILRTCLCGEKIYGQDLILDNDNAKKMSFTSDGEYLLVISGDVSMESSFCHQLRDYIYVLDKNGKIRYLTHNEDEEFSCYNSILSSLNNRYLVVDNRIIDVIFGKIILRLREYQEGKRCITVNDIDKIENGPINDREWNVFLISPSTLDVYVDQGRFDLSLQNDFTFQDKVPIAISASGRCHFYIQNNSLYINKWLHNRELELLRNDVMRVIPTLNDKYLYIVDSDNHIILYDVTDRQDVQIAAQRGASGRLYMSNCAKGLITYDNSHVEFILFEPDEKHKVNIPAVTTFARRWNLETKQQSAPTAVCPICGKIMDYDLFNCELKDYNPELVNDADWDSISLLGHRCPYCDAELNFNPYIL